MFNAVKIFALLFLSVLADDFETDNVYFNWQSYRYYKGVQETIVDYSQLKIRNYRQPLFNYELVVAYLEGPIDLYKELTRANQIQHTLTGYSNKKYTNSTTTDSCTFFKDIFNKIYLPMHLHHSNVSTEAPCPIPPGTSDIYPVTEFSQLVAPSILEAGSYGVDIKFLCNGQLCGGFGGDIDVQFF